MWYCLDGIECTVGSGRNRVLASVESLREQADWALPGRLGSGCVRACARVLVLVAPTCTCTCGSYFCVWYLLLIRCSALR